MNYGIPLSNYFGGHNCLQLFREGVKNNIFLNILFIFQATIPSVISENDDDGRGDGDKDENGLLLPDLEERLWVPHGKNKLNDVDIDKFLIIARSVGTFARALDCSSSVKQPSLHMSAAAA